MTANMCDGMNLAALDPAKVPLKASTASALTSTSVTRAQVQALIDAFRAILNAAIQDIPIPWVKLLWGTIDGFIFSQALIDKLLDFLRLKAQLKD